MVRSRSRFTAPVGSRRTASASGVPPTSATRSWNRRSAEVPDAPGRMPPADADGRNRTPVGHDEHAALRGELADGVAPDQVRPGRFVQCRFDRGPQSRIDDELLVEPAAAPSLRRTGDPPRFLLFEACGDRVEPAALRGE